MSRWQSPRIDPAYEYTPQRNNGRTIAAHNPAIKAHLSANCTKALGMEAAGRKARYWHNQCTKANCPCVCHEEQK